jgi:hypothetical protein
LAGCTGATEMTCPCVIRGVLMIYHVSLPTHQETRGGASLPWRRKLLRWLGGRDIRPRSEQDEIEADRGQIRCPPRSAMSPSSGKGCYDLTHSWVVRSSRTRR